MSFESVFNILNLLVLLLVDVGLITVSIRLLTSEDEIKFFNITISRRRIDNNKITIKGE